MDAELVALASVAASTVVKLLATDAWEKAKTAIGTLWRRVHPERADAVEAELVETRADILAATESGDEESEQALIGEWQSRLRRLLSANPELAVQLRQVLDEQLIPALPGARSWSGSVDLRATASGHGRVYQVGQGELNVSGTDR